MRANSQSRSWGTRFDPLPSSPTTSPHRESSQTLPNPEAMPAKEERLPHDASIFVGSLPPNMDQMELSELLTEHLSEHDEVKSIKVIRDSKGGVCAFVQCEDAASASALLNTLHSIPSKPFLGRNLRFEPARAFRTLLISYRTPMQTIPPDDKHMASSGPKQVLLDLPTAMRLRKIKNARYVSVFYNEEAREVKERAHLQYGAEDPTCISDLLLDPVMFDEETIKRLASHFGPLENFEAYNIEPITPPEGKSITPRASEEHNSAFPPPHDAPRSSTMNPGCWTVKWRHREDCVSALMNLRRVPHLTVTWSHQPQGTNVDQRFVNQSPAVYPFHVQAPIFSRGLVQMQQRPESGTTLEYPSFRPPLPIQIKHSPLTVYKGYPNPDIVASHGHHRPQPSKDFATNFPPLVEMKDGRRFISSAWADSNGVQRSPSLATSTSRGSKIEGTAVEDSQEIRIANTPELCMSPITPNTSNSVNSLFPITPTTSAGDFQIELAKPYHDIKQTPAYYGETIIHKELDPTAIFVGGLEATGPGAWDERRLAEFFNKFGDVLNVSIVRPPNQRSAFAFIKYTDTNAPARAVREAHNSVHDGRQMRVQLREWNPTRGLWKRARGRGQGTNFVAPPRQFIGPSDFRGDTSKIESDYEGVRPPASPAAPQAEEELPEIVEFPTIAKTDTSTTTGKSSNASHRSSSDNSSPRATPPEQRPATEQYREWYDMPNSATGVPSLVAHAPPYTGYYVPQPWMYPTPPQQYPYFGAGYVRLNPSPSTQPYGNPADSETSGTASAPPQQAIWPYPFMSYPSHAGAAALNGDSTAHAQGGEVQAPLAPAGFYQNEQGGLVAVYHPDQLGRYMARSHQGPTHGQPWTQGPYCLPLSAPPTPVNHLPSRAPLAPANGSWAPGVGPLRPPFGRAHHAYGEQGTTQSGQAEPHSGDGQRRYAMQRRPVGQGQHPGNGNTQRNGPNGRRGAHLGYSHAAEQYVGVRSSQQLA